MTLRDVFEATPAGPTDPRTHISRALHLLRQPGELVEIRVLGVRGKGTHSGVFSDVDQAAKSAAFMSGKGKGVYFTLNPIDLPVTQKIAPAGSTASDKDVVTRRWLLVDIEGVRAGKAKGNASDDEVKAALEVGEQIRTDVGQADLVHPLALMSGNGCHLLYRLNLPNDEATAQLVHQALKGLAELYNTEGATIDVVVANASRISKLPGTLTKKGEHTDERPCRHAWVLDWGVDGELTETKLREWAARAPVAERPAPAGERPKLVVVKGKGRPGPLERARMWLEHRDPAVEGSNGDQWTYETAGWLVRGFDLADQDALELLLAWNDRCSPPWSESELRAKCEHARQYGTQAFGCKLEEEPAPKPATQKAADSQLNEFPRTDLGNAESLLYLYGKRLRWNQTAKRWFAWVDTHWEDDKKNRALAYANRTARKRREAAEAITDEDRRKKAIGFCLGAENTKSRNACLEQVKAFGKYVIGSDLLDQDPWLMSVQNGTLDLRTGELREHRPEDYMTKLIPITWNPDAKCPLWEKFLDRTQASSAETITYLQRAAGYTLTGITREHAVFILHGGGRNGKSVFMDVLAQLLGGYSQTIRVELLSEKPTTDSAHNELAKLAGARLAKASETNQGFTFDEGQIKRISGEDDITARFMYADFFDYRPQFKLWLSTNNKPNVKGSDLGIWRRLKLIPWNVQIPEEEVDHQLSGRLRAELPGILAWAVRGCLDWKQFGLVEPEDVKRATIEYQKEMDVVGSFLEDCCYLNLSESCFESHSTLYEAFARWSKESGILRPMPKKGFCQRMMSKGHPSDTHRAGHERLWFGLQLKRQPASTGSYYDSEAETDFNFVP